MGMAMLGYYGGKWGLLLSGGRFEPLEDRNILTLRDQLEQLLDETGLREKLEAEEGRQPAPAPPAAP